MFSSACGRIDVYILKLSQEFEYESLTKKRVAVFSKNHILDGYPPNDGYLQVSFRYFIFVFDTVYKAQLAFDIHI